MIAQIKLFLAAFKTGIGVALVISLMGASGYVTHRIDAIGKAEDAARFQKYQLGVEQAVNSQLLKSQDEIQIYINNAKKAEAENESNKQIIDHIRADIDKRVQITFPSAICSNTTAGDAKNANSNPTSRALSEHMDAAFEQLSSGVEQLLSECEALNADAIKANFIQSSGK